MLQVLQIGGFSEFVWHQYHDSTLILSLFTARSLASSRGTNQVISLEIRLCNILAQLAEVQFTLEGDHPYILDPENRQLSVIAMTALLARYCATNK